MNERTYSFSVELVKEAGIRAAVGGAALGAGGSYLLRRPEARQDQFLRDMGVIQGPQHAQRRHQRRKEMLTAALAMGALTGLGASTARKALVNLVDDATKQPLAKMKAEIKASTKKGVQQGITSAIPKVRHEARSEIAAALPAIKKETRGLFWNLFRRRAK